jgi:triacylglycerol lipase
MISRNPLTTVRTLAEKVGQTVTAQAWEMTLSAAVMALTPLVLTSGLECSFGVLGTASKGTPPGTNPVVLVHGLANRKSCWSPVTRALRDRGVVVVTMSYPLFGVSIEELADQLAAEVQTVLADTGAEQVHLVGHSMGGLVIAQALTDARLSGRVDTVVTIGTPFGGSPLARVLPVSETVRALRCGSPLLRRLRGVRVPDGIRWVAFTAALDVVVPGDRAVPGFLAAQIVTVDDVGHLGLLHSRKAVDPIIAALPARPESRAAWVPRDAQAA